MSTGAATPANDGNLRLLRWLGIAHLVIAVATLYFLTTGYNLIQTGLHIVEHSDEPIPAEYAPLFPPAAPGTREDDQKAAFGMVLTLGGAFLMTLSLVHAVAVALVGRWILLCKRYTLCLVFSFFDLTYIPLGMALSIFALVVLFRPGVKQLFQPKGNP